MNKSTQKLWQEYARFLMQAPIEPRALEQGDAIEGMYAGSTEHTKKPPPGVLGTTFEYTVHYFLRADNKATPVKILGTRLLNECLKAVPFGSRTFIGRKQDIMLTTPHGERQRIMKDFAVEYWTDKKDKGDRHGRRFD